MALTPYVGLQYFGGNIPGTLSENGSRFTSVDRLTIDRLLHLLATADRHVGSTADLDPGLPTAILDDTGSLPGGMTYTYVVTLVGPDGIESLPSEEIAVTTPELLEAPIAPDVTVGAAGTLAPGLYLYALTAIRGLEESVLGDQVSVTLLPGETSVELAMPPDVPAGVDSWQVWRMEISDVGWTRVATADFDQITAVDDGSVPANPAADTLLAAPPSANAGVNIYAVEVTLGAGDQALLTSGDAVAWRLYRSETSSTFPPVSLVHHVSETTDENDPEAPVMTSWVDEGEGLITGAPPETVGRLTVAAYVLDHADVLPDPAGYPAYYPLVVGEILYVLVDGVWRSELGPQGLPGADGAAGAAGADGATGAAGPSGIVIVNHGADANYARPAGTLVYWKGTAKPVNALTTDWWLNA